jgi:NitT/TauT family transport system permease protein
MTTNAKPSGKWKVLLAHLGFCTAFIGTWEYTAANGMLNQAFFGQPSEVVKFLWKGFVTKGDLWIELAYTLGAAITAFLLGSILAIATGLLFVSFPRVEKALEPYLIVLNAMPRIALIPMFLLWFGLGVGSKIAVGTSLSFFVVLANTVAGIRGVPADFLTLSRTLGATSNQLFFKVTLPSAVPVIASGLRLAVIFSLLGVVAGELIAAERGLGQQLAYLQSTFNMSGVMAILVVLSSLGLLVSTGMTRLERRLQQWQ